jgi:hypothetical protein
MSPRSKSPVPIEQIDGMIRTVRGVRVVLDRDLAKIYGVATFRFNEAIKRNRHRFPADFMFQLTRAEFDEFRQTGVPGYDEGLIDTPTPSPNNCFQIK